CGTTGRMATAGEGAGTGPGTTTSRQPTAGGNGRTGPGLGSGSQAGTSEATS
ncbi:unnamed protein product, partial [Symbiodinium necroappetens]